MKYIGIFVFFFVFNFIAFDSNQSDINAMGNLETKEVSQFLIPIETDSAQTQLTTTETVPLLSDPLTPGNSSYKDGLPEDISGQDSPSDETSEQFLEDDASDPSLNENEHSLYEEFNSESLSSTDENPESTPSHLISHKSEIIDSINLAQNHIQTNKMASAILLLTDVITSLKKQQQDIIGNFFPKEFNNYNLTEIITPLEGAVEQPINFGVLFQRRYINPSGNTIDINLVFSDPSIEAYLNLINQPELVENLENIKVIKIKNQYNALEKYSEEENYCEQNIILNQDILLNIVANGIKNKET
ncbi:hypothetical protein ACFL96_02020, partial [Thermoproteota archaeon]